MTAFAQQRAVAADAEFERNRGAAAEAAVAVVHDQLARPLESRSRSSWCHCSWRACSAACASTRAGPTRGDLRLAADRAEMVPAIDDYMAALDGALLANSTGGDAQAALTRRSTPASRTCSGTSPTPTSLPDVGSGVTSTARRRPGAAGQGHVQQHQPARPRHHLRADPADRRGRRQRVGSRRRREDPGRGARAEPRDGCPRADDDAAAAGQPRRRTARARAAHLDDHPGRYRAVDAVRDEPGARRRFAGGAEAAGARWSSGWP